MRVSTKKESERGFMALITATLISFIVLVSVVSLSQKSLLGRLSLLHTEFKEQSRRSAQGCLTLVAVALYNNPGYTATSTRVAFNAEECVLIVSPNTPSARKSEVTVNTNFKETSTTLRGVFDTDTNAYIEIEEIP